jgi:hypothetical protein
MRSTLFALFVAALLAFATASPVSACNQRCNYATGECQTVGWITFQACETWSGSCVDVPVNCRAGSPVPTDATADVLLTAFLEHLRTAEPAGEEIARAE